MTAPTPAAMEALIEPSGPRTPWRPALVLVAIAAVIGLIVYVVVGTVSSSPTARWRTAAVEVHDVSSVVTGVATIEPVSEASVSFPVAGVVRTVDVAEGATVTPGQGLATLDPASFEAAVHTKQAALATAQLELANALDAQAAAAGGTTTTTSGGGGGGGSSEIRRAQQRVIAAQQQVDQAIAAANTALAATTQPCAAPSTQQQIANCQTALQNAASAQSSVASAQQNLATATDELDALLQQQANASTTTTQGGRPSGSTTTTVPTAGDIAVLQARVDAARAALTVAEQNLLQTVIVSPIAGRVVAVNLAVGQTVTASSTTATIVIQGPGGFESTMSVSVDQIPNVRVNQRASVLPDGVGTPISGRVAVVALAPTTATSGSTPTYRVTIALEGASSKLRSGTIGTGAIITATAIGAVAVPTSAVHVSTSGRTVEVLDGTTVTTVSVEVGVRGDDWTQILSGVVPGQQVVLADIDATLPGTATRPLRR